jgi:hypothetical protein
MAEYWFDGTDGSNSNDGLSDAAPKRSIASGLTVSGTCVFNIKRGTTVTVETDTYTTGDFTLRPYGDGTSRAKVYVTPGKQLTNTSTGGSSTYLSGIEIFSASNTSSGCFVERGIIYIDDVWIHGFNNGVAGGRDGGWVRNSRIWDVANNGITLGWTGSAAPNNFVIADNYINATGAANDGITLHDGTGTSYGCVISNNHVIGPGEQCIDVLSQFVGVTVIGNRCENAGRQGIIIDTTNTRVIGNYVYGSGYSGLNHWTNAGNNVFAGNVVIGSGAVGEETNGVRVVGTGSANFYNNTIVATEISRELNRIVHCATGTTGTFSNNIIAAMNTDVVDRYVEIFDATPALFLFRNNLYFGANGTTNPFSINNGSSRTFVQWQALSALGGGTQDIGGMVSDPLLDSSYRPRGGSPLIGAATYIAGARHMNGKRMSAINPTIGAYNYEAPRSVALTRAIAGP